jgi:hypothetical protein
MTKPDNVLRDRTKLVGLDALKLHNNIFFAEANAIIILSFSGYSTMHFINKTLD